MHLPLGVLEPFCPGCRLMGKAVQGGVLMEGEGGKGGTSFLWSAISLVYCCREET